ncbi:MAG: calcium/sodium antiporter [Bacteroidales bacterium]|nr:calcium/sodium antiporter [Bacteroidales bacterium]
MIINILILLAGLLLILLGANYLVEGSSSIARKSGISEFVIGLTIVGIGTSTPEMVVSFMSSYMGKSDMAIGNIVGSNIFNTMLILGITAVITPLKITRANLRRDIPMNIIATMLLILFGLNHSIFGVGNNSISRIDGALLLLLFAYYLFISFRKDPSANADDEQDTQKIYSSGLSAIMIIGGLAGLIFGGRLFVNSGVAIAKECGVSDAFIAITLMAGGTSFPELATCVIAALKKRGQLALGNILGSNVSNILLIIGGSALIRPLHISGVTPVDMGVMLLSAIFLLSCSYLFQKKKLDKIEGGILLVMWIAYMIWLIMSI